MTTRKPKAITINYKNAKLYTLRSPHTEKLYIGATTQTLSQRMTQHRNNFKNWINGKYHYVSSFEILQTGNAYIELLKECPCENKEQLAKAEGEAIRNMPNCCNKVIPDRTKKEYLDEYYKTNKEEINQQVKKYYEANREKIKEYQKQYRQTNKKELRTTQRRQYEKQYRQTNRDKIKECQKRYKQKKQQQMNDNNAVISPPSV